ncbi:MAG: hypothetical protein MUF42_03955 [Cytophagaceae bacterium]|jgi:hypothetical protein|nr:hypothetical protein [Cytophagaceae bacterium]
MNHSFLSKAAKTMLSSVLMSLVLLSLLNHHILFILSLTLISVLFITPAHVLFLGLLWIPNMPCKDSDSRYFFTILPSVLGTLLVWHWNVLTEYLYAICLIQYSTACFAYYFFAQNNPSENQTKPSNDSPSYENI